MPTMPEAMDTLTLAAEPLSVGRARTFVRASAGAHVDDVEAAVLIVSELVANVVSHARTPVTLRVDPGPPLRVEVRDGVAATEAFRLVITSGQAMPDASSVSGRGIALVHAMATRLGLDDDPGGGKVVWFELSNR